MPVPIEQAIADLERELALCRPADKRRRLELDDRIVRLSRLRRLGLRQVKSSAEARLEMARRMRRLRLH